MTENRDREITLQELAKKFARGDKAEARVWMKTLHQAVKTGLLSATEKRVSARGVAVRVKSRPAAEETVGQTTFAGIPCRVVAQTGRQAVYDSLVYVYYFVNPAAVAAWLHASVPDFEPPSLVRVWLGDAWPVVAAPAGKVDTKKEAIRTLLAAIAKADDNFSPDAMPGRKADFFELCRAYDRRAFMTIELPTFEGYLKGLCKFGQGARATDFYRDIAPQIGVKLSNPT